MLNYNNEMNTIVGGFKIKPSDSFHLSIDVARSTAEAEFDSFRMPTAETWAASKPNQSYDFSQTYLNSDLDATLFEAGIKGRLQVREGLSVIGSYRYLDFEDDAPYLGDTTGSVDYYGLGLGWTF